MNGNPHERGNIFRSVCHIDGDRQFFVTEGRDGGLPQSIESCMADIALIFHWPPNVMNEFDLDELLQWRELAVQRWNDVHQEKK